MFLTLLFSGTITVINRLCTPKKKYTSLDELRKECGLPTIDEQIAEIRKNRYRRSEPNK